MADYVEISAGRVSAKVLIVGAELSSLERDGKEFLWQADPAHWNRHAPVLFPIVGSIRDDKAISAAGPCAMGRHGFARSKDFTVVEQSASSVALELASDEETLAAYPFPFVLRMTYALEASTEGGEVDTLRQTFSVTNPGSSPMPFSVGGHPAFNVPAPSRDDAWEDYGLDFVEPWTYTSPGISDSLWDYDIKIPLVDNSDRLPFNRQLFAHDTIELEGTPASTVTLSSAKTGPVLRVEYPGFDYLGIWSPGCEKGTGPMVAIEPWTGTATRTDEDDIFEHKQGTLVADPGQTIERSFTITLL